MNILKKKKTKTSVIHTLRFKRECNSQEVLNWIEDIINSNTIELNVISLWSVDADNIIESRIIKYVGTFEKDKLLRMIESGDIQRIVFGGLFENIPVTVNFNLEIYQYNVGIHKDYVSNEERVINILSKLS